MGFEIILLHFSAKRDSKLTSVMRMNILHDGKGIGDNVGVFRYRLDMEVKMVDGLDLLHRHDMHGICFVMAQSFLLCRDYGSSSICRAVPRRG